MSMVRQPLELLHPSNSSNNNNNNNINGNSTRGSNRRNTGRKLDASNGQDPEISRTPFRKRRGIDVFLQQSRSLDEYCDEPASRGEGDEYACSPELCRIRLGSAVTSLHSSFDATLLARNHEDNSEYDTVTDDRDGGDSNTMNNQVGSIFRQSTMRLVPASPSWGNDSTEAGRSGRKHSLPVHVASDVTRYRQPGTVRKVPRRSDRLLATSSTPTKDTQTMPVPPSALKKASSTPLQPSLPSSMRRRRITYSGHPKPAASPFRKIPPSTPKIWNRQSYSEHPSTSKLLFGDRPEVTTTTTGATNTRYTPNHTTPLPIPSTIDGKVRTIQTCNTATTAGTSFDAINDTHDSHSPVSTPFRFTSFPASLPRVNPRSAKTPTESEATMLGRTLEHQYRTPSFDSATTMAGKEAGSRIRKHMSFTQALGSSPVADRRPENRNNGGQCFGVHFRSFRFVGKECSRQRIFGNHHSFHWTVNAIHVQDEPQRGVNTSPISTHTDR